MCPGISLHLNPIAATKQRYPAALPTPSILPFASSGLALLRRSLPSATAMSQLAGRCCPILGGGPSVNGPRRAEIHLQSRRQLAHFRSPRLWRAMASREPFKASRNHWEKLFLDCSRRYTSNISLFSKSPVRFFCSISSSRIQDNRFVRHTSEGETELPSYTWPDNQRPRVCILGGGFGGLYTALRLESLVWPDDRKPQVLLVDQSDRFIFKPMLYELLSGEVDDWEIAPPFTDLLKNTSVQFVKDRVKFMRPLDHLNHIEMRELGRSCSGGLVHLESGIIIEYDWSLPRCSRLVLALGAEAKLDVVPGSAEHAFPFLTLEDACKVNSKLTMLERQRFGKDSPPIRVAIVGCGYSGVELAATISERLEDRGIIQAINVETTICPNAPPGNRDAALRVLQSRKTQLFLGYFVSCIKEVSASEDSVGMTRIEAQISIDAKNHRSKFMLELQPAQRGLESQILEADIVLWTVGSKPVIPHLDQFDQSNTLPLSGRGQAETDETLRVRGHPRIFAIGDSAALRDSSGKLLPATAQVAFQQADFAGWNLWAAINDRPLLPFRFQKLGEMMTLGRNDAAISPSFIEGLTLDGPFGHAARKIAYLLRLPTDEHRIKVGISWLTKSVVDSVASLQSTMTKVISGS